MHAQLYAWILICEDGNIATQKLGEIPLSDLTGSTVTGYVLPAHMQLLLSL